MKRLLEKFLGVHCNEQSFWPRFVSSLRIGVILDLLCKLFFFPFPPPFLSFILFVLIAILVLTGGEHELVSLVTKSVRHPHKVGMCEVQTFSFLEKLWALKTSAVGQQCVFSGSRSRKSCVCHMQIYS